MCVFASFQAKQAALTFSAHLPKSGSRVGNSENYCWNKNQHHQDAMHANFHEKQTTLTFSAQICSKMDFGVEISKLSTRIWNLHF